MTDDLDPNEEAVDTSPEPEGDEPGDMPADDDVGETGQEE
jgi:hypothetical protein